MFDAIPSILAVMVGEQSKITQLAGQPRFSLSSENIDGRNLEQRMSLPYSISSISSFTRCRHEHGQ